jgi:hypothetical protein
MEPMFFSFEAEAELIADLADLAEKSGIKHSEPVPLKSPADALDAPIGADEIKLALELLTVTFYMLSAAVCFIDKVLDIVKKHRKKVVVRNPRNGQILGKFDNNSQPEEVRKLLGL